MKKVWIVSLVLLVIIVAVLLVVPATRESIHWGISSIRNSESSYRSYIEAWPAGKHIEQAWGKYDIVLWETAKSGDSSASFRRYINNMPKGLHQAEAIQLLDEKSWNEAGDVSTIVAYEKYLNENPEGKFGVQAKKQIETIKKDPAIFESALSKGTKESLQDFITDYPGHFKHDEAKLILKEIKEGRDIVDLISEKKIEVQSQGCGISSVSMKIRRLTEYPLTVNIPVGSYFVSSNSSAQNMVSTSSKSVALINKDWETVSSPAACANRERDVPTGSDYFLVRRSPNSEELIRLMPVLEKAGVNEETRQAAVWIVTDNADYFDLGILVADSGFSMFSPRAINEEEAARAMKICDEAGIDIKRKAIWQNRDVILRGIESTELANWLRKK